MPKNANRGLFFFSSIRKCNAVAEMGLTKNPYTTGLCFKLVFLMKTCAL